MAWNIQYNKSKNLYRIWTTVADGWITDWITREECIKEISRKKRKQLKEELDEIAIDFPNGYYNKAGKRYWDDDKFNKLQEHRNKLSIARRKRMGLPI